MCPTLCDPIDESPSGSPIPGIFQASTLFCTAYGAPVCMHMCVFSRVRLFVTLWTAALQVSLSFTISQSLLKLISIESVMPSSHLILCHPLLLLAPISTRAAAPVGVFSRGTTRISGSLSCSAREVRPPCVWPGRSRHCSGASPGADRAGTVDLRERAEA